MNTTVMAERQARAVLAIQAETERLGGQLVMPTARANNPAAKHTLLLEAIAEALAGIAAPTVDADSQAEAEPESKAAPKGKRGKEA